ncbi:hypothetical protein [Thermoflexus sp.]|uniref:hypothetical protein n=1 Tax=Thermoflexus sp. TaxID=1969742 RepID=UPI002ADE5828|nr:hypothetical protein [Thermoflexus sp.]
MNVDAPARTLSKAYANLDPLRPLQGEWLSRFYVERPLGSDLGTLQQELELDPSPNDKTLFTGARGSGKSTELYRLASLLSPDHLVVMMNVEPKLNLGDVDYRDLLVLLGVEIYQRVREERIQVPAKRLNDIRFWYQQHILEKIRARGASPKGRAKIDLLFAGFELDLSANAELRQIIRSEGRSFLADLIERLNALLDDVQKKAGRRVFVIVDGLDKVFHEEQVRQLFVEGANALMAPACRLLYAIPFALAHDIHFQQVRNSFTRFYALPNIKVYERDGQPYPPGRDALTRILHRRIAPELIQEEAVEALLHYSGGLIRELIGLTRSSLIIARQKRGDGGPITREDVEQAVVGVRNFYRRELTEAEYEELARFRKGGPFVQSDVALQLIRNLCLLEQTAAGTAGGRFIRSCSPW